MRISLFFKRWSLVVQDGYQAMGGLELLIPKPPKCWDCRFRPVQPEKIHPLPLNLMAPC